MGKVNIAMQRRDISILILIFTFLILATILGLLSLFNVIPGPWSNIASLILSAFSVGTQTFAWLMPASPNISVPPSPRPPISAKPNIIVTTLIVLAFLSLTIFTIGIGIQPLLENLRSQYPSYEEVTKGTSKNFSLSNQDENGWDTTEGCAFIGGAYHVQVQKKNDTNLCFAEVNTFSNFAFQAQMIIIHGDGGGGGIIFRSNGHNKNSKMYRFRVGQDASYDLYTQDPDNNIYARLGSCPYPTDPNLNSSLLPTNSADLSSSAVNMGLKQPNTLTVIAKGHNIGLYINSQLLLFVCNNFSSSGLIGLFASSYKQPSEVMFQNAKLWVL